jgi:hypothetical protein
MKFEASRAESLFQELGDPRYSGPHGEAKVADLVADRFATMGLEVERRDVSGSRFPQRAAPWVGWLGCGAVLTGVYGLILPDRLASTTLALALAALGFYWLDAIIGGRIRLGRGLPPLETAPVVIGSFPATRVAPVRVVFQAALGGLRPSVFHAVRWSYWTYAVVKMGILLVFLSLLVVRAGTLLFPDRTRSLTAVASLLCYLYPGLLCLMWTGIVSLLIGEHRRARRAEGDSLIERRGLAVLLEMARTWPRSGSRPIEPMFVAAGGHRLDDAGCREVVRFLRSAESSKPSLLMVLLAPGAGEKLGLLVFDSPLSDLMDIVEKAAQSLWIPIQDDELVALLPSWPIQSYRPAVVLVGSDPRALRDDSVDPQALHRAAQLATEVALRWSRKRPAAASTRESAG